MRPLLLALLATLSLSATGQERPNVVFIIADDLGWADVGFHGGPAPTPILDRLAREGLELTHHYVAPVCSPTRAGLMTGRFWSRFGVTQPQNERALPWETVTLPKALRQAGYDTCITGKWHLGSKPEWGPLHYGFDHAHGSLAGGVGPNNHFYKQGPYSVTWHRNEKLLTEAGHVTDLITDEAVKWLRQRGEKPFFLYLPYTAVHLPVKEPEAWLNKVPAAITGDVARHYAACLMHLDDSVGRILKTLEETGRKGRTLVVFTSDNGASTSENSDSKYPADDYPRGRLPGNNLPNRGEKGSLYEGGIRVPAVVSWPGVLKPGKYDAPVHITDWMPTLCALAGHSPAQDLKWDGANLWPQLSGQAPPLDNRQLYWTGPGFRERAVRDGPWKLMETRGGKQKTPALQLFNLDTDPGEASDLSKQEPEKTAALRRLLERLSARDRDAVVPR
jgi:arylsulfatase A-like enzyme